MGHFPCRKKCCSKIAQISLLDKLGFSNLEDSREAIWIFYPLFVCLSVRLSDDGVELLSYP